MEESKVDDWSKLEMPWVEPEFSSPKFITVRRITGFSRRILTLVWETQLGCSFFTL